MIKKEKQVTKICICFFSYEMLERKNVWIPWVMLLQLTWPLQVAMDTAVIRFVAFSIFSFFLNFNECYNYCFFF